MTTRTQVRGCGLMGWVCALWMVSSGCSDAVHPEVPQVTLEGPIVAIPRTLEPGSIERLRSGLGSAATGLQDDSPGTFYLALRRSELGKRWFMSVYLEQHTPESLYGSSATSLGVRVVSFQEQNGRLYAFDVDDTKVRSTLFKPEEIVEAWPVIEDHPGFSRLRGSDQYVLFDPAAGLDRVMGMDAFTRTFYGPPFSVELAFAQRFRALKDGVSFQKVITGRAYGYADFEASPDETFRVTATVGVALRRYQEGQGFTPMQTPPTPAYFYESASRIVPNTRGLVETLVGKWNIRPGMKPITWVISDTLRTSQADPRYLPYDIIGAVKKGVESWNQAFGFTVFTVRMAEPGESFGDDDKNFILFDPDPSYETAFANWRTNPNTGETLGASVYLSSAWLDHAIEVIGSLPTGAAPAVAVRPRPEKALQLSWNGMAPSHLCELHLADAAASLSGPLRAQGSALNELPVPSPEERVERFFTVVVMHEVGHTLGLRHNFKGSFAKPSNSVMEYTFAPEQDLRGEAVGPYDVAAVRYLYGLSSSPPTEPFCTDEDSFTDPDCTRYDATPAPLELFYGPAYRQALEAHLAGSGRGPDDALLNGVLQYLRASRLSAQRVRAWTLAMQGLEAPIAPEVLAADPGYGARADAMTRVVFQRLYLDASPLRGYVRNAPRTDTVVTPLILAQLRANLLDLDGVRTFATRKVMVRILKQVQTFEAYAILREGRLAVEAQLPGLSGRQLLEAEDLAALLRQATSPYFNN
ncbi:zinc-dependent metalloprotease [Myxococcus sp. MISCRS1]|uniref:zinc-dependent metalloprotease n=1 Tax=unclassified Myxococcus TaxID=2648731 RepID=UPI001CBE84B8|nr:MULTISPECIES: zinc-dependent metalloprotease [unclassified Myxococcus]MBZ4400856.1 zinc-dependent metalloprotease [Myxococcus sp. AS-1-15]MBZ4413710.1 zinc-dependent metalloprotease [Myxococcus sp. XM-1-1-1]MCY0996815.1 zinc-dependent metalloprotease [Myxococcus sp. MISCRS1]